MIGPEDLVAITVYPVIKWMTGSSISRSGSGASKEVRGVVENRRQTDRTISLRRR